MSFRSRLVLVAAAAVVIAVLLGATASYVAARDALLGSVDGTLETTAQTITAEEGHVPPDSPSGLGFQLIDASGKVEDGGGIPVTPAARAVAGGHASSYYTNVTIGGRDYRELVEYVGSVRMRTTPFSSPFTAALQVVLPLGAVDDQLSDLGTWLVLVAVLGVALALVLAWFVGRMALVPLNSLIESVEDVAETTDVSKRLDPGGADELGRLRRAFNRLLAALERSRDAQRQLVLDAGHELRTPLTSLRTNVEVVRRLDELSPADRSVLVDDLLAQIDELTSLVADISELARGEQRHSEPGVLRLDHLVDDAVAVARIHGRARGVQFELTAEPCWVRAQRERLLRAVGNLLDNALKWSPDAGTVRVRCADGAVTVQDEGPGIAPQDASRVFDRFYRAPSARSLPGSGLGLAIVAQVADAEGGSVRVVDTGVARADGGSGRRGACLCLTLPTVPPPGTGPGGGSPVGGSAAHGTSGTSGASHEEGADGAQDGDAASISSMRLPNGSST